ncbi:Metal homeostatis protein BSD2 [Smittium culicis]|uniref:Metal homeostatis protein BSD2 n=1 Tax=Smittium culicis TaxID=133412 RepID=A0A1R1XRZ6_9FUNG|nr:Metal homeostatis protein BSD2 [Smittium culicis]
MSKDIKYTRIELQPVEDLENDSVTDSAPTSGVRDLPLPNPENSAINSDTRLLPSSSSSSSVNPVIPATTSTTADQAAPTSTINDGVFSNIEAKPEFDQYLDIFEKTPDEPLPTYLDIYGPTSTSAPSYFEPAVVSVDGNDELLVDGLPVGSLFVFLVNFMISYAFQAVGFMMTFLLHTSHASKNGSIAGFGATLINIGFYIQSSTEEALNSKPSQSHMPKSSPNNQTGNNPDQNIDFGSPGNNVYVSFLFIIIGWCLILKSGTNYFHAKRMEQIISSSPTSSV